jgi:type I restriction enzyme S subunit
MAGEWREVMLEDIADRITVGHVGPMVSEYVPHGIPFLRSQNVEPLRISESDLKFITPNFHERLKKSALSPGDVVIVRTGKPGACAVIPRRLPVANCSDLVIVRCGPNLDPRFLAYYVNSAASHHVDSQLVGAVQQHFNVGAARKILMRLPTLIEQRAIAHILGTLDDKIELNRRMNETLEAIARALFKSWFVDFDPVRTKGEGRNPSLPKPLADLFPDCLEDSELGKIPKGWGAHPLGDLLSLDKGLSYKGQFLTEHGVPMVNLGCFLGRGRFAEKAIKKYSGEYKSRHVVNPRDLVLANTDITQKREVIGSPAIVPPQANLSELIFSHHVFAARFHKGAEFWKMFVYFLLLQDDFRSRAAGFATGTTVLALPRDAVLNVRFPTPPRALVTAFDEVTRPILEREWKSAEESRTLAVLRDTLLPKLISGELRVKDARRFLDDRGL